MLISLERIPDVPSEIQEFGITMIRQWSIYRKNYHTSSKQCRTSNNLIYNCYDSNGHGYETDCGIGVFVKSPGSTISKCIMELSGNRKKTRAAGLVYAHASTILKNNLFWKNPVSVNGYVNGG